MAYTADNIQVLNDLEHIRRRAGMYIGEANDPRQLLSEIFDNGLDEVQNNYSKELIVKIDTQRNIYEVRDFGRGIPQGKKLLEDGSKKEVLEILLTKANSGGKFSENSYGGFSCFTGDTLVKLTDGRSLSFEDLLREFNNGRTNYTYTCSEDGTISIEKIIFIQKTKEVNTLCKVTLDDGNVIKCTPEHKFMLRDGSYCSAENLKEGMSLMPGRFGHTGDIFNAYDSIWDNNKDTYVLCHRLADEYNVRNNLYTEEELQETQRHHLDWDRTNNNPDNITILSRPDHIKLHVGNSYYLSSLPEEVLEKRNRKVSETHKKMWENMTKEEQDAFLKKTIHSDSAKEKAKIAGSKTLKEYNLSDVGRARASYNGNVYGKQNLIKYSTSEEGRKRASECLTDLNNNHGMQDKALKGAILKSSHALYLANLEINEENYMKYKYLHAKSWNEALEVFNNDLQYFISCSKEYNSNITIKDIQQKNENRTKRLHENNDYIQEKAVKGSILKYVKSLLDNNIEVTEESYIKHKPRWVKRWDDALAIFSSIDNMIECAKNYNHKVLKIEFISVSNVPVYDLTVSGDNHNFLLNSGIFVHNCGLNGLGMTITNALSNFIYVHSYRKGKEVYVYSEGGENTEVIKRNTDEPDGTKVIFSPNKEYFHSNIIPVDFILNRCKIATALGFRARLIVDGNELDTNCNIYDLIHEEDSKIVKYYDIPQVEVISDNKEKMKVALRYTSDTKDKYYGFTNLLNNSLGGTHVQALAKTIIESWKEFINNHKNIKPSIELKDNDYLVGLRAVCAVFIQSPEFSSQTKEKLVVNKKYFDDLMGRYKKKFKKYLEENIDIANQLIKRFEEYRLSQNALLSRKEISSLIKINNDDSNDIRRRSIVSKLTECTSRKRDNTELFIVEGDSARGPYLNVRNKETQAVLPLRGKILNITDKDIKDCVKNNEICDIANSMGCGIGSNCDANKSRYERVIISADADIDGQQINCLVLSVFINLFPDMVKQGRVFLSMPPLYAWKKDGKYYSCDKVEDIPQGVTEVRRHKGLGSMDDDEVLYYLVNPNTRRLLKVDYPSDIDRFNHILGTSEGKNELLKALNIIETNI